MAQYDFIIIFRPGKLNGKADALTRRSGDLPEEGDGRSCPTQALIPIEKFEKLSLSATSRVNEDSIRKALNTDKLAKEIIEVLKSGHRKHKLIPLGECQLKEDDLIYINGLLYVPDDPAIQLRILKSCHDHPAAGHPERAATYELVSCNYWWPKMHHTIARYIRNCDTCARIILARHAPYGLLQPLEVPIRQWSSVSLNLITGLLMSNSHDVLLVVVDRLSKMAHYIPSSMNVTSKGLAHLYFDHIFRLHGIPDSVISERGTQFVLEFTKALCSLMGTKQNLSTSFHSQTDGQTERINVLVEQYVHGYYNYQQDDWTKLLTMAEYLYNNTLSASTGITPFYTMYGEHPRYMIQSHLDIKLPPPPVLKEFADNLASLNRYLRSEMLWAQATYAEQADKHRIPSPRFEIGDYVCYSEKT